MVIRGPLGGHSPVATDNVAVSINPVNERASTSLVVERLTTGFGWSGPARVSVAANLRIEAEQIALK